jgi:prepilin signal peptidase PulO-like enzyme (type II secretory pathway)
VASLSEAPKVRTTARRPRSATRSAIAAIARRARGRGAGSVGLVIVASLAVVRFGFSADALVAAFVVAVLALLSAIEIAQHVVPNRIVLPAAAVVLVAHVAVYPGRWLEWILAAIGTATLLLLPRVLSPGVMGMGDVKLGLLLGAALGYAVVAGLVVGALAATVYGLVLVAQHGWKGLKTTIPFAPFLAFGAIVVLFLGGLSSAGRF